MFTVLIICFQAKVTQLNVWYSKLGYKGQASELFSRRAPIPVSVLINNNYGCN